jgi:hypothetical protein
MSVKLYVNGMSVAHAKSGGKSFAFPDVCKTPSPGGPVPIPYPNSAFSSDTSKGSTTLEADSGNPIMLEDVSYFATSVGDEAGTAGGNMLTNKIKGRAYFLSYSMDVKVQGKNVPRHFDMMGHNCSSKPTGGLSPAHLAQAAVVKAAVMQVDKPCKEKYNRNKHYGKTPRPSLKKELMAMGMKCWEPGCHRPAVTPDHQPPLSAHYYSGGCHSTDDERREWANNPENMVGHCSHHSQLQATYTSQISKAIAKIYGW